MRVHNVKRVSDVTIRKLYQKSSPETQDMAMTIPRITSLGLVNIKTVYHSLIQAPSIINISKPRVLSLTLNNRHNKLKPPIDPLSVTLPNLTSLKVTPHLQRLSTWGLDETINLTLPNDIKIHIRGKADLHDIQDVKIDNPLLLDADLRYLHNETTQLGPAFGIALPQVIELRGSVKPVLTIPVLVGTEDRYAVSNKLTWDDSSITHSGYWIYKSLEPIPIDTTQEPYKQIGRDVNHFDDLMVDKDTTYYYRVTPKSVYGNLFSNQVELLHFTAQTVSFMIHESPTYTPLRVDNNIIPLVPTTDTEWDELNASFEHLAVTDVHLITKYTPSPTYIEMRNYNE